MPSNHSEKGTNSSLPIMSKEERLKEINDELQKIATESSDPLRQSHVVSFNGRKYTQEVDRIKYENQKDGIIYISLIIIASIFVTITVVRLINFWKARDLLMKDAKIKNEKEVDFDSFIVRMTKLNELKTSGAITNDEFNELKKRIQ